MMKRISATVGNQLHGELTAWAKDDGLSLSQLVLKLLSTDVALRKAEEQTMSSKKSDLHLEIVKEEVAAKEAIFDAIDAHDELKRKEESSPKEEDLLIESLDQAAAKEAIFDAIAVHEDVKRKLDLYDSEETININRFPFLRSKP